MTSYTLPNGLVVVIEEDHAKKIAAIELWVMVGSADEDDSERGISHLIEHMAFKGTARRGLGQITREAQALGCTVNARTNWDSTVFHIVGPSLQIEQTLDILADAVLHPSINEEELSNEKKVVLEEILENEESLARKASQLLFSTAFVASPYKYPVIGYKETVEKFTRDDIMKFRSKWYGPENMFFVVVGDVHTPTVLREIEKLTAELKPIGCFRPPRSLEPFQKDVRSSILADKNTRETVLNIAFHIPSAKSIDINPLHLAADILAGHESSRLVRSLKKDKGLVNSISEYFITSRDPCLIIISATLDFSNLEPATRGIMQEIMRLADEPPTTEELDRSKTHVESDHLYSLVTVQGSAANIGESIVNMGDPNYSNKYLILNKAVTPEEISEVTRSYLAPNKATISVLGPEESAKDFQMDTLVRVVKSFEPVITMSLPDQLEVTWPQATSTRLSNGIQVIVIPDDANQLVSFKILHLGGKRFETEKTQGIMNFVASMLTKGAGDLQEFEISKRIEEKGGRVSCFSGWDSFGVSLTILSHYIEFGVNLLSTIFKNPTFPKREMERERQFILNKIKNETDDPVQFIVNRLCKILYGSHPYGFNTLGTLATVSKFSEQDLMDCYRQFSNPSNTVISVVGAIDPGNALKIIDKFFGDVPPSSFEPPIVPFETRIDQQREEILRINKAKAHIVIGFKTISLADQDRYPLDVLNNLLSGQGGRLFLELRDKKSLAYSVTSFLRYKLGPGFMGFYIACATPKVDRAVSGLLAEIEKIKSIKISDQEIRNSKANLIGNHETSLQTTWSRADNYGHNTLFGLGWNYDFEYTNKILEVKAEDVSRVARRYLDNEKRITVKIIPESHVE